jgi:hypothetical protein
MKNRVQSSGFKVQGSIWRHRLFIVSVSLAALLLGVMASKAGTITTRQAVDAIIGEAGDQSFTTQVAVACAIRNRGTLQGVYGLNNPVVQKATPRVRAKALRAWQASARQDIVKGCKFFGCPADAPALLSYGLQPVCMSGAITFYTDRKSET